MSTEENALPSGVNSDAGASESTNSNAAAEGDNSQAGADNAAETEANAKPEKTPEQREIDRLRRGIDRRTRQLSDARAQLAHAPRQQEQQQHADDSEPLSLTRAQIQEMVIAEAQKLAPTLREEAAETERRQGVVQSLAKTWGQERFDEMASDLDEAFGGLADRSGRPKPATDAIFYSENPQAVIEFLADPENADEADRISRMSAIQAGRAIGKLEDQLAAAKLQAKPKPSNAPKPLEPARSTGAVSNKDPSKMNDTEFAAWRRQQIKQRNK